MDKLPQRNKRPGPWPARKRPKPAVNPAARPSLLTAVLVLHFIKQKTQKQIAEELGFGIATINRWLAEGRSRGLIEFKLKFPQDQLAVELKSLFPGMIRRRCEVVVVPSAKLSDPEVRLAAVGRAGAALFEGVLRHGQTVTLDGGKSVARVIEYLQPTVDTLKLYPVAGGPLTSPATSVPAMIGRFMGKYGPDSKLETHGLPAPMIAKNVDVRSFDDDDAFTNLQAAESATVFLLGVGSISHKSTPNSTAESLLRVLNINKGKLLKQRILGVTGYSAFDKDGNPVESEFDRKVYKVRAEAIRDATQDPDRHVIVVAAGEEKACAIRALVKGGWATSLVTDFQTAEEILRLEGVRSIHEERAV